MIFSICVLPLSTQHDVYSKRLNLGAGRSRALQFSKVPAPATSSARLMASPSGKKNQLFSTLFFLSVFDCHALSLQKANASKSLNGWPTPSLPPAHTHLPHPLLSIYPNAPFVNPEIKAHLQRSEISHRCISRLSWSPAVHLGTNEHSCVAWQRRSACNVCMCVCNCLAIFLPLFLQSIIVCPPRKRKVQVQNSFELSKHILSLELLKHATSWKINHCDNIWHLQINQKMTFYFIRWSIFRWRWSAD